MENQTIRQGALLYQLYLKHLRRAEQEGDLYVELQRNREEIFKSYVYFKDSLGRLWAILQSKALEITNNIVPTSNETEDSVEATTYLEKLEGVFQKHPHLYLKEALLIKDISEEDKRRYLNLQVTSVEFKPKDNIIEFKDNIIEFKPKESISES